MHLIYKDKLTVIDIDIREKVTLIGGDSASGKTYFITRIKHYITETADRLVNGISCNVDADTLVIFEGSDLKQIQNYNNKLIIIDRFDYLMSICKEQDYVKDLMDSDSNTYIVMSRNIKNFKHLSFNSLWCLQRVEKDNKIYLTTKSTMFL